MVNSSYSDTALYYCVDDLPHASVPGSRLQKILGGLRVGKPVTRLSLDYLQKEGLDALYRLAVGSLLFDNYRDLAIDERRRRIESASVARVASEAAKRERFELLRKRSEAARIARENDPKYIAKKKNQKLRARYGVDNFVEEHCFRRLMKILKMLDAGQRMKQEDFVWLSSVGELYFSDQLRAAYHRQEAEHFAAEFAKTRDPWKAVNASSHYRKCNCARKADSLLDTINVDAQKSPKLKSALCTTRGGVMRDLRRWDEGLELGEKAHSLAADDYRPCTLLGAIYMETGNFTLGHEWYEMAVQRGATNDSVDRELRSIFFRVDQGKQAEMREFLLNEDPDRYAWAAPVRPKHQKR